ASDIDTETLTFAERGMYPLAKLTGLTRTQVRRYFLCGSGRNDGLAVVRPEIRALIDFRHVNLSDSSWQVPDRLDAIFCRNVMIYFSRASQGEVLHRFARHLAPDGLLFAGHSENILYVAGDAYRSHGKTIYQVTGAAET
ncbi:MAG: CheR family methyltransferase, partial [Betaproteobacteria bacterium]